MRGTKGVSLSAAWVAQQFSKAQKPALQKDWETLFTSRVLKEDLETIVAEGLLPVGVEDMHKQVLAGPFLVQISEAVDVSVARYDQLMEFEKEEREAKKAASAGKPVPQKDKAPKPSRVLKLVLSDGKKKVAAMEKYFIKQIPTDPPVGAKVRSLLSSEYSLQASFLLVLVLDFGEESRS